MKITYEDGLRIVAERTTSGLEGFVIAGAIKAGAALQKEKDPEDPKWAALADNERQTVDGLLDQDETIAAVHGFGQLAGGHTIRTSDQFWSPRTAQRAAAGYVTQIAFEAMGELEARAVPA